MSIGKPFHVFIDVIWKLFSPFAVRISHIILLSIADQPGLRGCYISCFCEVLQESLEPYRSDLLKVEEELLQNSSLTASHVQSKLEKVNWSTFRKILI